ncbi:DUF3108 domain-containing protein [Sulfurivermis fontis]|uniref:DUF3108 domain-containing protein n=1 Tax=Sulfurivermis fontis TaxID=1972068 RepID=UPI000FD9E23E|nr:DUF3108 domain-containing protein [Sulfurivermis fontis]
MSPATLRLCTALIGLLLLAGTPAWAVGEPPLHQAGERLDYRISYRGVFTAYVWKDLADMALYAFPGRERFNGAPICRATMTVDTRNYGFAEFSYPVRLRYDALAAPDLSFTHLVSDHDDGVENIHNVMWFDWEHERIKYYRKRLYVPAEPRQVGPRFSWETDEHRWEADGKERLPAFLTDYAPVGDGLSYLIHDHTRRRIREGAAMDPLTMLYALRTYDYDVRPEREIAVVHKEQIGRYVVRLLGRETMQANGQTQEVLHVRVRKHDAAVGAPGQLDVWLADDQQRVITRFDIEAKVGLIRVDQVGRQGSTMLGGCVDGTPLQWASR